MPGITNQSQHSFLLRAPVMPQNLSPHGAPGCHYQLTRVNLGNETKLPCLSSSQSANTHLQACHMTGTMLGTRANRTDTISGHEETSVGKIRQQPLENIPAFLTGPAGDSAPCPVPIPPTLTGPSGQVRRGDLQQHDVDPGGSVGRTRHPSVSSSPLNSCPASRWEHSHLQPPTQSNLL